MCFMDLVLYEREVNRITNKSKKSVSKPVKNSIVGKQIVVHFGNMKRGLVAKKFFENLLILQKKLRFA